MILWDTGAVQEVQMAKLQFEDGHMRYFNTSDQIVGYLKARPDQKFRLDAVTTGATVYVRGDPNRTLYSGEAGDVFCGDEVWYDSGEQQVKTLNLSSRLWGG
ncbi:hypothetical protein B0G69_8061 [Paraburkholderia sp. RAU2J]|nr:hypothetical protein B0G69_8061 [Paraburkholderia sp. RAU2J]